MTRTLPILLRRTPINGRIVVLTNYLPDINRRGIIRVRGEGKHDVTADFDAILCEMLLDPDCGDIVAQLDGAVRCPDALSKNNREEIARFLLKLIDIIERHNNHWNLHADKAPEDDLEDCAE